MSDIWSPIKDTCYQTILKYCVCQFYFEKILKTTIEIKVRDKFCWIKT